VIFERIRDWFSDRQIRRLYRKLCMSCEQHWPMAEREKLWDDYARMMRARWRRKK
jgi:hypothetical protein